MSEMRYAHVYFFSNMYSLVYKDLSYTFYDKVYFVTLRLASLSLLQSYWMWQYVIWCMFINILEESATIISMVDWCVVDFTHWSALHSDLPIGTMFYILQIIWANHFSIIGTYRITLLIILGAEYIFQVKEISRIEYFLCSFLCVLQLVKQWNHFPPAESFIISIYMSLGLQCFVCMCTWFIK
jgi:hypothetical protein